MPTCPSRRDTHWLCDCVLEQDGKTFATVNVPSADHCWRCGVSRPHRKDGQLVELDVKGLEYGDAPGPAEKISDVDSGEQ